MMGFGVRIDEVRTSLLVSIWFIGGMIMMAIGITGIYIGKIYKEVKQRPRYFIEEDVNLK